VDYKKPLWQMSPAAFVADYNLSVPYVSSNFYYDFKLICTPFINDFFNTAILKTLSLKLCTLKLVQAVL